MGEHDSPHKRRASESSEPEKNQDSEENKRQQSGSFSYSRHTKMGTGSNHHNRTDADIEGTLHQTLSIGNNTEGSIIQNHKKTHGPVVEVKLLIANAHAKVSSHQPSRQSNRRWLDHISNIKPDTLNIGYSTPIKTEWECDADYNYHESPFLPVKARKHRFYTGLLPQDLIECGLGSVDIQHDKVAQDLHEELRYQQFDGDQLVQRVLDNTKFVAQILKDNPENHMKSVTKLHICLVNIQAQCKDISIILNVLGPNLTHLEIEPLVCHTPCQKCDSGVCLRSFSDTDDLDMKENREHWEILTSSLQTHCFSPKNSVKLRSLQIWLGLMPKDLVLKPLMKMAGCHLHELILSGGHFDLSKFDEELRSQMTSLKVITLSGLLKRYSAIDLFGLYGWSYYWPNQQTELHFDLICQTMDPKRQTSVKNSHPLSQFRKFWYNSCFKISKRLQNDNFQSRSEALFNASYRNMDSDFIHARTTDVMSRHHTYLDGHEHHKQYQQPEHHSALSGQH